MRMALWKTYNGYSWKPPITGPLWQQIEEHGLGKGNLYGFISGPKLIYETLLQLLVCLEIEYIFE